MNWLERARREIGGEAEGRTANAVDGYPSAVTAVLVGPTNQTSAASNGSNGSGPADRRQVSEEMKEAFEGRASILEFDDELPRVEAEERARSLVVGFNRTH